MTYQELLALINPSNAYTFNQQVGGGSEGFTSVPTTVDGAYLMDPSNPMGGYVWDGGGGALSSVMPADGGGVNWTQYAPGGAVTGQGFDQDTSKWYDSLLGAVGTLGGAALGANALGALMGGGAGAAAGGAAGAAAPAAAPAAAAAGGVGATGAATAAGGAMLPMVDDWAANGSLLSTNPLPVGGGGSSWASLLGNGASSLLSNGGALAAGAGALAGIAGNGDLTNTNTTTQGLAPWMQPYAQDYMQRASWLTQQPTTNESLQTAGGLLGQYATQGDPLVNAARGQQQNVIGGGMLNSNPYIDQVAGNIGQRMGDAYAVGTRAGTASAFNNDGNSVGGKSAFGQTQFMNDRAFGDSLGSTLSNLYMGNYNQERAAQDNASRASLGFGQFATNNAQNLYNAGAQDWQRPYAQLGAYGQAINPSFGSQGTQSQTIQAPNNWMAGLGGAALGAGMYRSIFGGR